MQRRRAVRFFEVLDERADGRGAGNQSPAGEDVISLTDGAPLAVLAESTSPWPKASGHEAGYQFGGYDLDQRRRPTFMYSFGKVDVRDSFEAVEAKPNPQFKRTLTIQSKEAPAGLWFRAAVSKKIETKDGFFVLDSGLRLKVDVPGATVRPAGGTAELLVPILLKDGAVTLTLNYVW